MKPCDRPQVVKDIAEAVYTWADKEKTLELPTDEVKELVEVLDQCMEGIDPDTYELLHESMKTLK